jgi:hypothetical protein
VVPRANPNLPSPPLNVTATLAASQTAHLSWAAPVQQGASAITNYEITGSPSPTTPVEVDQNTTAVDIGGLTGGLTYTFTVAAKNSQGVGAGATSAGLPMQGPPQPPTNLVATRGDTQVALSWTAPANTGGLPLGNFTITASPSIGTVSVATSPKTITGLTNGTTYTFTITANNADGGAGANVSATPATVPSAPQTVSASPGNGQATVSWTAPASNGGLSLTGYTITTNRTSGTGSIPAAVNVGPGVTSTAVAGLSNGSSTYSFTIVASNAVGNGSGATTHVICPSTNPGVDSPPQNVSAVFANVANTATVSWAAPVVNTGLTGYTITPSPSTTPPTFTVGAAATSTNINVLTGGISYTFTVVANNSVGASAGAASGATPIQGPPQPPTLVTATPGANLIAMSWNAPANNGGSAITSYRISTTTGVSVSGIGGTSANFTTGNGLAACSTFTVQVQAVNTWGTSGVSNTLTAADATAPNTPGAPAQGAGVDTIFLSWTAPAANGCAIDEFFYNSVGSDITGTTAGNVTSTSFTKNPCHYNGLHSVSGTCNQSWQFQVWAHNAIGWSGASAFNPTPVHPLVSWSADNVDGIVSSASSPFSCAGCHFSPNTSSCNPLHFDGGSAGADLSSINANSPPVIQTSNLSQSFLLLCPTQSAGCTPTNSISGCPIHSYTSHPGGQLFLTTDPEYTIISQWLFDGRNG